MYKSKWFIFLMSLVMALWSLGHLQRVSFESETSFYLHDLAIFAFLVFYFFIKKRALLTLPQKLRRACVNLYQKSEYTWLLLIGMGLWTVLGMAIAFWQTGDFIPFLYLGRLSLYALFGFSLWQIGAYYRSAITTLWLSGGLVMIMLGWWQYLFLPDLRFLSIFGWDDHYYRLAGPLIDPNYTGLIGVLVLIWISYKANKKGQAVLNLAMIATTLLFVLGAISLTFSRSTYFSLLAGLLVFALRQKQVAILWLSLILGLAMTFFVMASPKPGGAGVDLSRIFSLEARLEHDWTQIASLRDYQWWLGRGVFSLPIETQDNEARPILNNTEKSQPLDLPQRARLPNNLFVILLVGTGLVGLVGWSVLIGRTLKWTWQTHPVLIASGVALLVHAQFNNSLLQPFVLIFVLGMVVSLSDKWKSAKA